MLVTLVVGMIVGAYLYVFGFSQQFTFFGGLTEDRSSLSMSGNAYGGCERGGVCGSFQLQSDGTFRTLLPSIGRTSTRVQYEGELSASQMREIRQVFTGRGAPAFGQAIVPDSCASDVDGIDYVVRVSVGGTTYTFSTCDTAIARDATAMQVLRELISGVGL